MKKVFICIIALLLLFIPLQTVTATSGFSLTEGVIAEKSDDLVLLQEFFKGMLIDAGYSSDKDKYMLSGTNDAESTKKDGTITSIDKFTGEITGEYYLLKGDFSGTFTYYQSYDSKDSVTGIQMKGHLFDMSGEFTGIANPKDTTVTLTFHGINQWETGGTKDYVFNVMFTVGGALPLTKDGDDTVTPEETAPQE